jgi:tetratricopeptide (TPR) repeat protein
MALQGHYLRLIDLIEIGDVASARAALEAHARLAGELRQPLYLWQSTVWTATLRLLEGRFDEAERLAEEALLLGERAQEPNATHCYGLQMLGLRREQGRLDELAPAIEAFGAQYGAIPGWRAAFAYVCAELGREDDARREFEQAAADDFAGLPEDMAWLVSMTVLAETCVRLGDVPRARVLYDRLLPYAGRVVPATASYGAVARSLGLLATTLRRWDAARQHLEAALELNARIGARPWVAWTQYGLASMHLARGDGEDAEKASRLLARAAKTAAALGQRTLADRVEACRQRLVATRRHWRGRESSPFSARTTRNRSPVR